jgi:uncharacterized protein (DUF2342 family)
MARESYQSCAQVTGRASGVALHAVVGRQLGSIALEVLQLTIFLLRLEAFAFVLCD